MRIYRYIPDGRDFAVVDRARSTRFWPEGIELGRAMDLAYPRDLARPLQPAFSPRPAEAPLADFTSFTLTLPMVSRRAGELLARAGLVRHMVPVSLGAAAYFVIQPLMTLVDRALPVAFVAEASRGLPMPDGEPFFYPYRVFAPQRIPGEFFTIPAHEPYSSLYVTDRLVDLAAEEGLTGLAHLELVFDDDGPVVPRYPRVDAARSRLGDYRLELEWELVRGVGDLALHGPDEMARLLEAAVAEGYIAHGYPPARSTRQFDPTFTTS